MHPSSAQTSPAAPSRLDQIKHIIVVMLENRSFDNLLGWLYETEPPPRGQSFEGLNRSLWNPLNNVDSDGIPFIEQVFVRKNGEPLPNARPPAKSVPPNFTLPSPDPGEGFRSTNHQLFGTYNVGLLYPPKAINQGFVNDYHDANLFNTYVYGEAPSDPREIMITYTPEQAPVLSTLARQFAVCDHWYASVPSETLANRHFVHAGTSEGAVNNHPVGVCGVRTIYEVIQTAIDGGRADLRWKIYGNTSNGKYFSLTRSVMTRLQQPKFDPNFVTAEQFYADAKGGTLPSYAFLEPRFHSPGGNDQHPPQDIRLAEKLIADVYEALLNSPQWNETLLVITYDEHGGCYDHVPPPNGAKPPDSKSPAGQDGFMFNRFGVRVPTVLVSPWIEAGTIGRPSGFPPFDHTSILATVRRCLGLTEHLTERDLAAPDVGCCMTLAAPRTDKPAVQPQPWPDAADTPHVNDLHETIADLLQGLTGLPRPQGEAIFEYVHTAYEALMMSHRTNSVP